MSEVLLFLQTSRSRPTRNPPPNDSFGRLWVQLRVQGLESRVQGVDYRVASLIKNSGRLGPYSRTRPRALW
jgi:hypothetical protein